MQAVVIDARAHMLGRLASIVAKQILSGHHVVSGIVRTICFFLLITNAANLPSLGSATCWRMGAAWENK